MNRLTRLSGVVVGILSVGVIAHSGTASQRPIDPDVEAAFPPVQTLPDIRGTEQQPLVVRPVQIAPTTGEVARVKADQAVHAHNESLVAYSTLGLAGVTAILALFTYLLWLANKTLIERADATSARQAGEMQRSIEEATRAARAMENVAAATRENAQLMSGMLSKQMRAYVSVDIGRATYQDQNLRFASNPVIVNTGFTPAKNVSYRVRAAVLAANLPSDYQFDDSGKMSENDATLAPRQSFIVAAIVQDRFEADEVQVIMKGETRKLFVWGTVTYDDVFGGTWETRFCHSFAFYNAKDEIKVNSWYHPTHNSTT